MSRYAVCSARGLALLLWCVLLMLPGPSFAQDPEIDDDLGRLEWDLGDWKLRIDGFLRAGFIWVLADESEGFDTVGNNNGFGMFNGRLGFDGTFREQLRMRMQLDGAIDVRKDSNDTVAEQSVGLLDAFIEYTPHPAVSLMIGQGRPPTDVENLVSRRNIGFVRRSVVSDGVRPTEGLERPGNEGLGSTREVGAQIYASTPIELGGGVGLRYNVAVTNGTPSLTEAGNDNNALAYYGRVELHFLNSMFGVEREGSAIQVGGFFGYNERTTGDLPNLLSTDDLLFGADLLLELQGARVMAVFIQRERAFPDLGIDNQVTRGIMASAGYTLPFRLAPVTFSYRFAWLDPFVTESDNALVRDDGLMYHTVGVGYRLPGSDLEVLGNYTITQEEEGAEISNDLIEILVQLAW